MTWVIVARGAAKVLLSVVVYSIRFICLRLEVIGGWLQGGGV